MGAPILRKVLPALLALALLLAPAAALAQEAFTVERLSVQVDVGIDNVYDITETITVNFSDYRHGIYRDIPTRGDMVRQSAEHGLVESNLRARVGGVRVEGAPYDVSSEGDFVRIRIGDADRTVIGEQTYRISYRYSIGDDRIGEFDEVYYNLIGNGWDTTIEEASFDVTLPVDFDPVLVGFAAGLAGEQQTDAVTFSVDGRTISGRTSRPLGNFEGLTLRVELPEGTFVLPDYSWIGTAILVLMWILAALAAFLFWRYGRDESLVRTVEFYPPDGMTPAEVGYLFDGSVDNRDVISLLLYWADRGYLTITDLEKGEFRFQRTGEPGADAKPFERHMFSGLFATGDTVDLSELKYTFFKTIDSTRAMVKDSFATKERRVFTKASLALEPLVSALAALPVIGTLMWSLYISMGEPAAAIVLGLMASFPLLATVFLAISAMRRWRVLSAAGRVGLTLAAVIVGIIGLAVFLFVGLSAGLELVLSALATTAIIALSAAFIRRRTPQGTAWLGRVLGLRDFLVRAERDRILQLVEHNPSYFYNVLPYAYVLNVTDKWAKNFEGIALQPPDWYSGTGAFTPVLFAHSLTRSMGAVQSVMVSHPPSNSGGSGGGFSGGGFSGGGGGGGGGGSW